MSIEFTKKINFTYGEARELVPGVLRVVCNNPSPLTFKGTNTYVVGTDTVAIIDPGPDDAEHCAAILRAVAGRPVSHLVLTHAHGDHSDGLARLQAATKAPLAAHGYEPPPERAARVSPEGREVGLHSIRPEVVMRDRDVLKGDGWSLEAMFTPGHAPDHLCFALGDTGVVFSGDHVMSWNTTVVAPPEGRMRDYLASLERLRGRTDKLFLPGHGGKLANPERMVRAYQIHRQMREEAIRNVIGERPRSIEEIVALIYPGLEGKLIRAASLSVQAHVEHLAERRLVTFDGPLTWDLPLSPS